MSDRTVSRSVDVAASAATIFAILADPRQHPRIDGSGSVRSVTQGPQRLQLGSRFRMRMRIGLPYLIANRVVEFEEGRRIAWRHFARHVWRYEIEPRPEGGTRVTETFDYRPAGAAGRLYELLGFAERNARGIEETLPRLKEASEAGEGG